MPLPVITSAFRDAGARILNTLIDRAQDFDAQSPDEPKFFIIETWARLVQNGADLGRIFNAAQEEFTQHESPHARTQTRWLDFLGTLFEFGGEATPAFVSNLWRAYIFRLNGVNEDLWLQYPDLRHAVSVRTDRQLPAAWGDWIIQMQTFMGIAEALLVEAAPEFNHLLTSQDVIDLLEGLEPEAEPRDPFAASGATFVPDPDFDATATLIAYLAAFIDQVGRVDPRGLPQISRAVVPLDGVYTPLLLTPITAFDGSHGYTRYQTATSLDQRTSLSGEPASRADSDGAAGIAPQEALFRSPQALILGEAGCGKTTLLRYLAHEAARGLLDDQQASFQIEHDPEGGTRIALGRPLPIYVDLAEYIDNRGTDESLQSTIMRQGVELIGDQGAVSMLTRFLEAGQCLILLDGLDQAATDEQRRMLSEEVSQAAAHWHAVGNRVAVTSRLAGASGAPLAETFTTYLVRPLDRSQFGPFLLRWSLALVRLKRPLLRDEDALQQAQTETLALVREVTTNPHLAALAASPLMLRLLAGIFRQGTLLTPQRVAVYQMVADALIRDWRLPQTATNPPAVLEMEATTLLGHLAYWLHSSRPAGRLNAAELKSILSQQWRELHPDSLPEQSEAAIGDFIGRLKPHLGALVELEPGQYSFVYQGIQEYFAARYFASSYRLAPERIRRYLHDPRWDEVIRLAIGFTSLRSQEDASDLIEAGVLARGARAAELGHRPSPFEDLLRRDLFFAARLLGAGAEARPAITGEIVRDLMALWLNGDRDSIGRYTLIFDAARQVLSQLDGTQAARRALGIALEALGDKDEHRRAFAADAVTFWPSTQSEAVEALVRAGRGDQPPLVERAVAQALGRVGELPVEAYRLLLGLVNDKDDAVAEAARETLRAAQPAPQEALNLFVDMLHHDLAASRRVALRQLRQVGALPPSVIAELIHVLSDPDAEMRQGAMDALASAAQLPDHALMTICRMAMDTSTGLRLSAVNALRRPVELPPEVIVHLVDWTYDPDVSIRRAAALALGDCLNTSEEVMEALVERLDDPVDSVRAEVVGPLAHKGPDDARVMHVLAHAGRDPTHRVRCAVAEALRFINEPNVEVRTALKNLLNDREVIVREAALATIGQMDEPGGELIDEVTALARVQNIAIGVQAVRALAHQRELPPEALSALISALPSHWENEGREIADCLKAHYPLGMELLNRVMDLAVARGVGITGAGRHPDGLRALALEILGHELNEAQDIHMVLIEAAKSSSPDVQVAALRGLGLVRVLWPDIREVMFRQLSEGTLAVRCAAGIALGRLMHTLPDPPLSAEEMSELAERLATLLREITPRAAWEDGAETQNDLLRALSQVMARGRPSPPRLPARADE